MLGPTLVMVALQQDLRVKTMEMVYQSEDRETWTVQYRHLAGSGRRRTAAGWKYAGFVATNT